MAKVLVEESQFVDLLAAKAAITDDPLVVALGDTVLSDAFGEIYPYPCVVSVPMEGLNDYFSQDDECGPECDCE